VLLTYVSCASQRPVAAGRLTDQGQSETHSGNLPDAHRGNSHQAQLHQHTINRHAYV